MKRARKMSAFIGGALMLLLLLCVFTLSSVWREDARVFQNDLVIQIPDRDARLIIREWQFLLGSGAEVYYQDEKGNEILLDHDLCEGDDGYMAFADGKYQVHFSGDTVTLEWYTGLSRDDNGWRKETYQLP